MTRGYMQIVEGEWIEPAKGKFINQCCDCSLTHVYTFEVFDGKTRLLIPGARLQFKLKVDRRMTAASRRKLKLNKE